MLICHVCLLIYLTEIKWLLCSRYSAGTIVEFRRVWHDSFQETYSLSTEMQCSQIIVSWFRELEAMYFREARDQFLLEFNSIQFAQNFARLLAECKKKKKKDILFL